jgi:hypothetical protein
VKPIVALAGLSGLCAALVACGTPPPPPKPVGAAPSAAPAAPRPTAAVPTPAPATAQPTPAQGAVPPAQGTVPPAQGTVPAPGTAQSAPFVVMPPVPQASGTAYDPKGRRDPFQALDLIGGPKGLDVSTTKLTGIVRSARTTLALIETSDGIGYILKPGDTLGDGRLMEIAVDSVVFAVGAKPGFPTNRVVLKLAAN